MQSLLSRGTTFERGPQETTADLALASDELARQMLKCQIHDVENGSDHRTIVSVFGGQGKEETRHFLFQCRQYQHLWGDMINRAKSRYGDLSYMIGGRSSRRFPEGPNLDGPVEKWKPNMAAVKTIIKYALSKGGLGAERQTTMSS